MGPRVCGSPHGSPWQWSATKKSAPAIVLQLKQRIQTGPWPGFPGNLGDIRDLPVTTLNTASPAHHAGPDHIQGEAPSSGGLSLLSQTRPGLRSCLFTQSSRPLRKWLCLFPSVLCEPWAKYTHTTASPAPALEQHAPFCWCALCKSSPQDPHPLETLLPPRRRSSWWRGRLCRPECLRWAGAAGPFSVALRGECPPTLEWLFLDSGRFVLLRGQGLFTPAQPQS